MKANPSEPHPHPFSWIRWLVAQRIRWRLGTQYAGIARMSAPGRDERGLYAKGNPGGPGRSPARVEIAYLLAARESVPLERYQEAVRNCLAIACGEVVGTRASEQVAALRAIRECLLPGLAVPVDGAQPQLDPRRLNTEQLRLWQALTRDMMASAPGEPVDVTPEPRR